MLTERSVKHPSRSPTPLPRYQLGKAHYRTRRPSEMALVDLGSVRDSSAFLISAKSISRPTRIVYVQGGAFIEIVDLPIAGLGHQFQCSQLRFQFRHPLKRNPNPPLATPRCPNCARRRWSITRDHLRVDSPASCRLSSKRVPFIFQRTKPRIHLGSTPSSPKRSFGMLPQRVHRNRQ